MFPRFRRLLLFLVLSVAYIGVSGQCTPVISVTPSCSGPCTGILSVSLSSGCTAGPYSVEVTGCSNFTVPGGSSPTLIVIPNQCTCSTTYFVEIKDNTNTSIASDFVNYIPNPLVVTGNTIATRCNTSCDGRIQGNIVGTPPYSVSVIPATVSPSSFTTSANTYTINNICAGGYTINVADKFGCSTSITRTVQSPPVIQPNPATKTINCNSGNNGGFSVSPTGGTGTSYTINFSNGTTSVVSTGGMASVNNLTPGAISATITDVNSCTVSTGTTITQPSTINIVSTQTNVNCGGTCIGVASVAVSGGGGIYTYSWSSSASTGPSASSLCAGGHTVTINDNLGCTRTRTFNITQPSSITITPTITNVTCNGLCNGAASVTASGPPGTITFTWLAPPAGTVASTSSVISGRCPGIYTLQASATPTCVNTFSINITQPPAITLTALTNSVTCSTLCNGSATANVQGGNAPFSFTWTASSSPPAPQTGAQAINLCAKVYTLAARDASNCTASFNFSIGAPPPLNFGVTTTSVNCNGACNGVINASPSGGTAPYTFTLISATSTVTSGSANFTGLCAGTYSLRVKDNSPNCAQQTTVSIAQPNPLVPSVVVTSITCAGSCNGILAGSANGGTPGYTLSWNTPTGNVAGGVLSNRCAGSYTFNITDSHGCTSTPTVVTLTSPPAMTVNINVNNATCSGTCNGVLSGSVSGGTPGYTLNWSTGFTGNPLTNRCAGNYTLTVTDSRSCIAVRTATVSAPPAIVITNTVRATNCAGSCDGSATVSATGGAGSYTYQFNTSPVVTNTTGIILNRCAGNYIATVTDANGCGNSANFSITSPAALSAAITGTRNSCTSCTGAGTVTPSNGTPPYTAFAWTNSLNVTVGTTSAVTALCPGNYTVRVTDSRSCTATTTVNISQIVIVAVVSGGTGIQCFGSCTGSAVASPSGGQAPYSFSWSPGSQTTGTATGLCAGSYTVRITDSNSPACSSTASITVTQPSSMTVVSSQTNVTCSNLCNGAISLSVTGGTGTKSFSWSPGGMTTSSITGRCAGVYTVNIRDANNCPRPPLTFTLAPPFPSVTAVLSPTNPTNCNNPNTGSIQVTASGGNGTYTYSWSPGGNTTRTITNVPAGTYSVMVTSSGCTYTFISTLTNPAGPTLTQTGLQNVSCFGGSNGAASFSAAGVGPFSYTWTPALTQNSTSTTSSVTGLATGTYVIASTDAGNSCITTRTLFIAQPSSVTPNGVVSNIQCAGSTLCNGSITVTPTGGVGPYTYTWTPFPSNTNTVGNLCAGNFTVNLRDNNQCPYTFTFNVTVPTSITVSSTITNVQCNSACNGSVVANATGGTGPVTYSWLPQTGFTGSTTATVLNLCPGTYTLRAIDGNNCFTDHTVAITEPAPLTSTLTVQGLNCANACTGGATLTASGGVPTYSFSWSSSAATTSTLGSLCAGNYVANVVDGNNCISSQNFTITAPPVFSLSLAPAHPLCNAACNGSIQTTVAGAQGTVAYVWIPAGTGQNPSGLCAAIYTVNATDSNGCQALAVTSLTNPPAMLANVTTTNTTCNGQCDGAALSTPVNNQGAVSYTWLPSGPNAALNSGLCGGTYTLDISDANNCTFSQTFAVSQPALLNVNVSSAPASCNASNGSITAAPVGGTPGYTFAWTSPVPPPITATGSVVSGLPAGIYTVAIADASGCSNTITIPLSNSNGPTAPLTSTNVVCNGQCTGAASVGVISNGTPPYAVPVWIIPTPTVQASALFSLCAQGYSVQLIDSLGCVSFTGLTISEPPPISILPTATLPLCAGVCNGTVTINTSGGIAPYSYTWMPGSTGGSVLANACAGTYSVLVGYNNGSCTIQQTLNIAPQTSITVAPPVTDPNKCFGDCAGSATVNVISTSGGTASLSWNNGQTGSMATGLCTGIYSVNVTDGQGCTNTFSVPITSPPPLSLSANVTQPDCGQCNGSSTVSASGGSGSTYTYNWTTGASGAAASALCAGLYQVQVTDSLNCLQTVNLVVNSSSGITGDTITALDETCAGLCDGSATVTAIGGNLPVSYSWLNTTTPNSTQTASNLCHDIYYVQMTDASGCGRTASLQISPATDLNVAAFITPPTCGNNDGSARVTVSGGTGPFNFSWTPALPGSGTVTGLPAGNYTVVVTEQGGSGCSKTLVIAVPDLNGPAFSAVQTNISCGAGCNGAVVLTSTATPLPTYNWSTGSNSGSVTGLCEGVVSVTVSSGGCITTRNFTISEQDKLLAGTDVRNVRCYGDCNGRFAVLANGGTLPYTFSWNPAQTVLLNVADSLCAGAYSATITDVNGCSVVATASVNEAPAIVLTSTVQNSSCSSVADGAIQVAVTGGAPTYTYSWQGPDSFTASTQDLSNVEAGTYTLNLVDALNCFQDTILSVIPTVTLIADAGPDLTVCPRSSVLIDGSASQGALSFTWTELPANLPAAGNVSFSIPSAVQNQTFELLVTGPNSSCQDRDTVLVNVFAEPFVDAGPSYTIPIFSTVVIGGNPTTEGVLSHTWSPSIYLDDPFIMNPVATNSMDVTYTVSIAYGDGCLVSDSMAVMLFPEIKITSAFSPNDDGRNDTWIIDHIDQFPENTVEIYNRWGEQLFFSKGYAVPFDGMYRGKKLPVGTYYYVIRLNDPKYLKPYTGPLTIFR